jgi:lysine 2,3-aminomutase
MKANLALLYTPYAFRRHGFRTIEELSRCLSPAEARDALFRSAASWQTEAASYWTEYSTYSIVRDCARAIRGMCGERATELSSFDFPGALFDLATAKDSMSLSPAFIADVTHILIGLERPSEVDIEAKEISTSGMSGRVAAVARTADLDRLWNGVEECMKRYGDGMSADSIKDQRKRRRAIQRKLGSSPVDWADWRWHASNALDDVESVSSVLNLTSEEASSLTRAQELGVPFAVTPYYASLISSDPASNLDAALRAQVLPPSDYVEAMSKLRKDKLAKLDFMLERDTSPVDLVTRRYPAIAILKPFNACPQICVYCQRNWEIDSAMAPDALAGLSKIEEACRWIEAHPAIREILITGGEPLAMDDDILGRIMGLLAANPRIDVIRIGTRAIVTMPMRITEKLTRILASFRKPGIRDVCVMTHVQHPREVTPELAGAVDRLKRAGISVYNQMVFTFFVSRRFEASGLRMLLRRCGIDPYYTFVPKGKEETSAYRVPIARILQEQKEEARLLPGTRRTDTPVYNVPGLGKSYLRAFQHRDLVSILPDGSRVYEFHPWEKNISRQRSYVGKDVPILEYLNRLASNGEDISDYSSIWYYF